MKFRPLKYLWKLGTGLWKIIIVKISLSINQDENEFFSSNVTESCLNRGSISRDIILVFIFIFSRIWRERLRKENLESKI